MVKNLPAVQETRVQSLGQEDLLEKGIAIHSSIPAWRILWTEEPGGLQSVGLQRDGHDWVTNITTPKLIVFSHSLSFENWIYLLFNCSVISDSLRSHGLQPTRPPCPSLSLGVYSKLIAIESMMPPNHLILCHPLLLPSIFPSIRVFSNESALRIRWPKYWSFSFSICPSNEYSGLISFRIDWFDLLTVQGTLEGLLRHHSLKASVLWHSAFFMVQLSHPAWQLEKP